MNSKTDGWRDSTWSASHNSSAAAPVGATAGSSALAPESPDSSVLSAEREVWRVEATPGRQHGVGIYDLCFDWSASGWTLLRSHD